ncbi:multicopper oxidase family protein [Amycolatopsis thermophila]|uniref:FtsP/CotA-like multicopper oxidase with cupredoxin domain n=1 Tax=Amycolatopsis thermophila TaxID=206084 RepID=A0ABU0F4X2_9PSEU|nr:multicopper oxidase family protein [Amycolatopsis thermophila]MDQ0382635.1 FtsP/CotA-like multicopper oxidase with cupredoxin domain [Amycolatopsis thermophila]
MALALLVAALLVTLTRVATVVVLTSRGWWFGQEKALLVLPMQAIAGLVAGLVAGPRLLAARRAPGEARPATSVVVLLTAAYAALAGLVVTFVVGYPLTWSAALIAISLVYAGALLTRRVLATPVENTPDHPGISRRRFIGLTGGAIVASTAGTGVGLSFLPPEPVTTGGGPGPSLRASVPVTELRGAGAPAPGGTLRQHVLTARTATVRLPSGRVVDAWTFDGELPGPAITATQGDLVEVRLRNADIAEGVTLHWHGYDVPCGEDGVPGVTQDVVAPGADFVYRFRADQVGTYWYHTHHASHEGVRRGLYGPLVVTPRDAAAEQLNLTLPVHTFDGTVVIADQDGRTEHTAPAGRPVRLRLINTDSDPHRFALAGTPFRVAAVDGRDLNQPGEVTGVALRLAAGGRYDLVFTMPDTPVVLVLDNDRDGGLWLRPPGSPPDRSIADPADWPELDLLRYGTPAAVPFDPDDADRHFTMVLDRGVAMVDGSPAYAQTVNGHAHPSIPDQLVAEGDVVRFTVVNRSLETHPWHLHGHPVLILSKDGVPATGSPLWMDSFDVRPGEVWEVVFQATNPGIWMNHCHNLPHMHQGMMLRLRYDGITGTHEEGHEEEH